MPDDPEPTIEFDDLLTPAADRFIGEMERDYRRAAEQAGVAIEPHIARLITTLARAEWRLEYHHERFLAGRSTETEFRISDALSTSAQKLRDRFAEIIGGVTIDPHLMSDYQLDRALTATLSHFPEHVQKRIIEGHAAAHLLPHSLEYEDFER